MSRITAAHLVLAKKQICSFTIAPDEITLTTLKKGFN